MVAWARIFFILKKLKLVFTVFDLKILIYFSIKSIKLNWINLTIRIFVYYIGLKRQKMGDIQQP